MASKMDANDWEKLMKGVKEITQWHQEGMLFIGGVAVFFHSKDFDQNNYLANSLVEFSHDADFMISAPEFSDLRDIEQVTNNNRLSKSQIVKHGIEYDIYVQSAHNLCVSYEDAFEKRKVIEGFPVACLEHLLGLKMMAYEDRKTSIKGEKDRRDIAKIVTMNMNPDTEAMCQVMPYIDTTLLKQISNSTAFTEICGGNAHQAKALRDRFNNNLTKTLEILEGGCPKPKNKGMSL